ncbi:MAG TPA: bifunctional (p)ppGpp synthetase/guanosine-3',5'-bis(diphosphate) 3'-pyrophosphohydrolase [Candidatus Polarisedimenticolia bacterium]|nr:bifunctional (p)ppGpp synthetase/guanosine-3',5'-bis(diphosphate) 3'-pyrophosphohydrolase [Candidatus Polarisedimenticolia bacterium]
MALGEAASQAKIRFEDITDKIEAYHPDADLDLLRRAYIFSAMEHKGQVRRSGEPYLMHPLEVANILADLKLDVTSVAVGLLHDVIEDTLTTREVIEEYFGREVADLVEGLSKISKIPFTSEAEKQAENFRKMLLAMVGDIRIILVKLADRLHNMRTLSHLIPEKRERIARETLEIYAPLANRLGMGKIKQELEDLALAHLDPEGYQRLVGVLEEKRRVSDGFIQETRDLLVTRLKEQGIPAEITGRMKHLYSIHKKMKVQKIEVDEVYDYVAFRVITDSVRNCYGTLGIIHGMWRPIPGRIKDFIAMPKPNLYQSLHTSVMSEKGQPFEIQIRTREMHEVAEKGIAAHWKYKEGRAPDAKEDLSVQWLQKIVEWHKEVKDPREFLETVKVDLYPEEVYAFTPKGEVRSFPKGATVVDFAYAIHTEVGHHCARARVNRKLVPLKTELHSGDVVEIVTSASRHPSRDWLGFVTTSHARHKIRHWLNTYERRGSVELGRALLEKECKRYKINMKSFKPEEIASALASLKCDTMDDFAAQVGYGKLTPSQLLGALVPSEQLRPREESLLSKAVRRTLGLAGEPRVMVKGLDSVMIYLARCCRPIRGEEIVGYITRGKGVSVHRTDCTNLSKLLFDPERKIEVAWERTDESLYEATLTLDGQDRPGLLAQITGAIADEKSNIKNVEARTSEDRFGRINIVLDVRDRAHLERIMEKLRRLEGVRHVERTLR